MVLREPPADYWWCHLHWVSHFVPDRTAANVSASTRPPTANWVLNGPFDLRLRNKVLQTVTTTTGLSTTPGSVGSTWSCSLVFEELFLNSHTWYFGLMFQDFTLDKRSCQSVEVLQVSSRPEQSRLLLVLICLISVSCVGVREHRCNNKTEPLTEWNRRTS